MPRIDQKMPAPTSAPAAGATTTFRLPIGRRYHSLQLRGHAATAFTVAEIDEIRVLLNNKIVQRFSGADRNAMNRFDGREDAAIDAGSFIIEIPFDRYGLLTRPAEEETAINTGSVDPNTGKVINSFSLEIDLASSGITGTPSLELWATMSEQLPGGPGTVPHILKSTRDFAGAGEYEISDLPRGGVTTQFLDKVFMRPSTSTIDNLKVLANQTTLFERSNELNERKQRDGIRHPQSGWYVIDRTEHGYGGDPFDLRGLEDWRLKLTTGAALTLTMYSHYLGGLGD